MLNEGRDALGALSGLMGSVIHATAIPLAAVTSGWGEPGWSMPLVGLLVLLVVALLLWATRAWVQQPSESAPARWALLQVARPARAFATLLGVVARPDEDAGFELRRALAGGRARADAGAPQAAPTPVPPPDPNEVLRAIRASMDEVSYTPGTPNVLSMTKYTSGEGDHAAHRPARSDRGDSTVVALRDVLDAVAAPEVRSVFDALIEERRPSITLDVSALRMIDSAGVGLIVRLYKRCSAFGGQVRVSGLRDQPLALFRLLRLDRIFTLQ